MAGTYDTGSGIHSRCGKKPCGISKFGILEDIDCGNDTCEVGPASSKEEK